jgi:membrane-bound ClpP family serine protease
MLILLTAVLSALLVATGLNAPQSTRPDSTDREWLDSLGNPTTAIAETAIAPWSEGIFTYIHVRGQWMKVRSIEPDYIPAGSRIEVVRRVKLVLLVRTYQPQPLPSEFAD